MKVYRGFNCHYDNFGSPPDQPIWVTVSPFYASTYAQLHKGRVVEFDLNRNDLKLYHKTAFTPVSKEFMKEVLDAGCNAWQISYGKDCFGCEQTGWAIIDKTILRNPEIVEYWDTLKR